MVSPTEKHMNQRKKEIPAEIIALVAPQHRFACKKLVEEFQLVVEALAKGPFAGCKKAIDAVIMLLEDRGPMKKSDIVTEVIRGGFLGGDPDLKSAISAIVELFIGPSKSHDTERGLRIGPGGLVGLKDWPDEMFYNKSDD